MSRVMEQSQQHNVILCADMHARVWLCDKIMCVGQVVHNGRWPEHCVKGSGTSPNPCWSWNLSRSGVLKGFEDQI